MSIKTYDVVIVGLGSAGAAAAICLDKKLRVAVIDKKSEEFGVDGFQKPCGGLLSPDAQKCLARLNMTLPKSVVVGPQVFHVRTIDFNSGLERLYHRHYINVDRHRFDLWLATLLPKNVEVIRPAECVSIDQGPDGYSYVRYRSLSGVVYSLKTKYVIGADGANSIVRKQIIPARKIRSYLAIQQWFVGAAWDPSYFCFFDKNLSDIYCWGLSKDRHFILGGAFSARNAKNSFQRLKEQLAAFGFLLGPPVKTEACLVNRPRGLFGVSCGKGNVLFAGEAAGFISASSLEGISYGILSGHLAAEAINRGKMPLAAYRYGCIGLFVKMVVKGFKGAVLSNPFLRFIIMKTGIGSMILFRKIISGEADG